MKTKKYGRAVKLRKGHGGLANYVWSSSHTQTQINISLWLVSQKQNDSLSYNICNLFHKLLTELSYARKLNVVVTLPLQYPNSF